MNDEPLLPCPFCKLDPHIWREQFCDLSVGDIKTRYYIQCNICGGRSGDERSITNAINAWNTRNAKREKE